MIAVIYARYSDGKQGEQSIEGQLKICEEYAQKGDFQILRTYIDRAQSGRTDNRIQFQKMLADSKKGQFDAVLVYAINRFGRNARQALNNAYILEDNDISIISATEFFDRTPSGRMFRTLLMAYDQYFSDELTQKVNRGLSINAEKGLSNGGATPLGYRLEKINPADEKSKKKYALNEETAPIVREVFTKYANGESIKEICDSLNARQLKSAKGAKFNKSSLHTMLKNRKYLGIYIYGDTEIPGKIPQIIDEDLFDKVAEKMVVNKKNPARSRAKAEYILSGKLYCGHCKEKMIGHSSNKISKKGVIFNYYKCKNAGGATKTCNKKMVDKNYIEDRVVEVCSNQLTPENIRRIAKEIVKIAESLDDNTEIKRLEKLIQKNEKEKENQMASLRACEDGDIRDLIFGDLNRIIAELKELNKQLELENARREAITEEKIIASLTRLVKGDINDINYRRNLIRVFVNKIFLYDNEFIITLNSGEEEVEITVELFKNIERVLKEEKFCLLEDFVHQMVKNKNSYKLCDFRRVQEFLFFISSSYPGSSQNWRKIYKVCECICKVNDFTIFTRLRI